MGTQYRCENPWRRAAVRDTKVGGKPILNGIDYLEVLDQDAPAGSPKQRTLLVRCFAKVPSALTGERVGIEGGVRVTPVKVLWAHPAKSVPGSLLLASEKTYMAGLTEAEKILVVRTDSSGDYSTYRLTLTAADTDDPPLDPPLDPQLSAVLFSFKVECSSDFDCRAADTCRPEQPDEPVLDYLAKDYASFRRLMLDRMSIVMPDWEERNAADVGIALVEALAYAGDHLSYFQDAVATEAYLGTARKRTSIRRHARLLDYPMHDGCNARVWVTIEVKAESSADGYTLPGLIAPSSDEENARSGMMLLTQIDKPLGSIDPDEPEWKATLSEALGEGAVVFETIEDVTLYAAHNEMYFHTWCDDKCCLPRGATHATLKQQGKDGVIQYLKKGDVLIFEEVRGSETGNTADADPSRRHAVRLTEVRYDEDPLDPDNQDNPDTPIPIIEISWAADDALPSPLNLWKVKDQSDPDSDETYPVSIARGNVVLADHGYTISPDDPLETMVSGETYRPMLEYGPVTQQGRARTSLDEPVLGSDNRAVLFNPQAPAKDVFRWKMGDILPAIWLKEETGDDVWLPQRDLLNSDRFADEFVVEIEDNGDAFLRFGDGIFGSLPVGKLKPVYRIGNGISGNVGANTIVHVVTKQTGITAVRNPLPAQGGVEPESIELVRLYAPQAFRTQERAVTEADYAAAAERHPEVQKAAATRRWTRSWYTMFVTVDRKSGEEVDEQFQEDIIRFLDRFRLAGYDLEVDSPLFVPLDIALTICVESDHFYSNVKQALLETFSNRNLPDGRLGFFHPDNFTFGKTVYLSQVLAAAMEVPGVKWVDADDTSPKLNRFQRWGRDANGEVADGRILLGRLEIARLDNDPNQPENGKIEFNMQGGL
jgi:hypothetical protein